MNHKNEIFFLVFLVLVLVSINYNAINGFLIKTFDFKEPVEVERVIDGDTVVLDSGEHVRLLGINTPERGEMYYSEAKEFLEKEVLGKVVYIERMGKDKYYRDLGYLFSITGENINSKIIEEGYANYYFYSGKDRYSDVLISSWNKCLEKGVNLCEKSKEKCLCVEILSENGIVNNCGYECNITGWSMGVEGRSRFYFNKTLDPGEKTEFNLNLEDSGRSLFLRDELGKLVSWEVTE